MSNEQQLFAIDGKVALVTGGTRGIGLMIARGLVKAGVTTYVSSRKADACAAAEAELRQFGDAVGIAADLSDRGQCQMLADVIAEREGKLHILVNNAGASWGAEFDSFPEVGWDKVMDLNLRSVFFLTQKLMKSLRTAATSDDPARVINIGSIDGLTVSAFENFSYSASKAALHHLTRQLAHHLAADHININAIAPGPFETKMTKAMLDEMGDQWVSKIPRRRTGNADDVAGTTIFLCSAASAYITGAVIPLDGGYSTTR
jgi:NAD(P)-dependent dehydrogenase (short-subunit alcohol dehydrogenase family)